MNSLFFSATNKVQGFFRIQVIGEDGKCKQDTGYFPNLITNQGMDWLGNMYYTTPALYAPTSVCQFCYLGTGSTTPAFTDTQLTAYLGYINNVNFVHSNFYPTSSAYVAGPPAYWSSIFTFQGAPGAIVGNIAELGVGGFQGDSPPPTSGTHQLFSHALIVTSGGVPTTISVTAADTLIVTYELRMYLDLTDHTYNITINSVAYSGTYRMAAVTTVPNYSYEVDIGRSNATPTNQYPMIFYVGIGTIVPVTSTPTWTGSGWISRNTGNGFSRVGTYTPGSYTLQWTGSNNANVNPTTNITVIGFATGFGLWQFSVSPAIPYQTYQKLTVNYSASWARY